MPEAQQPYLIERRPGEIERLHVQSDALIADTLVMLDRIGVEPGWRCVDLGCGPRGITDLLSTRVGPTGQVVGLDADAVVVDQARQDASARGFGNVEFVTGDVFRTDLPVGSFDLVHTRFVLGNVGNAEGLLQECARLTRPGGCVAFQDADITTLNCYPSHPAWDRLKRALADILPKAAGNPQFAHSLYRMLQQAGFENVQYRPFVVGFRSSDPMSDYLPATMESFRSALLERGLTASELNVLIAECRAHLADSDTVSTYHTVVQAWGTRRQN
jgi:ubiquinone/menaquinone biosynthesis C-methylase UbiE